jgi:hypothetical protein
LRLQKYWFGTFEYVVIGRLLEKSCWRFLECAAQSARFEFVNHSLFIGIEWRRIGGFPTCGFYRIGQIGAITILLLSFRKAAEAQRHGDFSGRSAAGIARLAVPA